MSEKSSRSRLTTRAGSIFSASLLIIGALAGCGGGDDNGGGDGPDAASVEDFGLGVEIVQAAQEEGTVVHAAAILDQEIFDELAETFEERYGIEVEYANLGASEVNERIRTESRAGQSSSFDTLALGAYFAEQLSREQLLQPFRPNDFDTNTVVEAESDDYFPLVTNLYGIAVNRSLVSDSAAPESWQDLASLEIDAPVLMHDPSSGSGGYIWLATMMNAPSFGEDYLRDVGQLPEFQLGSVIADNVSQLVRGEVGVYFPMTTINIADIEGTDVEFVAPSEGPVLTPIYAAAVKGAVHPNAAELWLSFLWSKEGQELLAQGGQAPIRSDAESPDPRWDLRENEPVPVASNEYLLDHLADLQGGLLDQLGIG